MLEQITHSREDWENEATVRAAAAQTCAIADTHSLIAAVGLGKNLKTIPIAAPTQPGKQCCYSCYMEIFVLMYV